MISTHQPKAQSDGALFEKEFFATESTYIHPTAIIGPNVKLGNGVKVGPFCILVGNITVGEKTRFHANVTVGFPAQDVKTFESFGTIEIGSGCEIREFVTIHASKKTDGATKIGNNCYIMNYCHISHDVVLEDNVILINNVMLAGHCHIEKNVMLMASSALHQFCRVGKYSTLAPFSGARQDLPPFSMFNGKPAFFTGLNRIGLRRSGVSSQAIDELNTLTKLFYQRKLLLDDLRIEVKKLGIENSAHVQDFLTFVAESQRGVSRRCAGEESATNREGMETPW